MRPSTRILVALVAAFLVAFWLLRGQSRFLRLEGQAVAARAMAQEHGLTESEVLALGELVDGHRDAARWRHAVETFVRQRPAVGHDLAVLAAAGHQELGEGALVDTIGDRGKALAALSGRPEALAVGRFAAMRDRFAARTRD